MADLGVGEALLISSLIGVGGAKVSSDQAKRQAQHAEKKADEKTAAIIRFDGKVYLIRGGEFRITERGLIG